MGLPIVSETTPQSGPAGEDYSTSDYLAAYFQSTTGLTWADLAGDSKLVVFRNAIDRAPEDLFVNGEFRIPSDDCDKLFRVQIMFAALGALFGFSESHSDNSETMRASACAIMLQVDSEIKNYLLGLLLQHFIFTELMPELEPASWYSDQNADLTRVELLESLRGRARELAESIDLEDDADWEVELSE